MSCMCVCLPAGAAPPLVVSLNRNNEWSVVLRLRTAHTRWSYLLTRQPSTQEHHAHCQVFKPNSNRVSYLRCTCKRCSPSQDFRLDCRKCTHVGAENVALAFRPERPSALHKASLGLSQPARHRRSKENHVLPFVELSIQRRQHVVLALKAALQLYER